jgi:RND family efflux transporter MFP subunit
MICRHWLNSSKVVIAGWMAIGSVGCQHLSSSAPPTASVDTVARVAAIKPERKTIRRTYTHPAQIDAFDEAPLYAKVPAYVERYLVDIGDVVTGPRYGEAGGAAARGQLLAELSAPELDQELLQKKAQVAQSKADVEQAAAAIKVAQADIASSTAKMKEAVAAVDRAEADFQRWDSEYNRVVQMVSRSAVTQKLADETKAQMMAAMAGRKEVEARVETAQAAIVASEARLEKSKADELAVRARLQVAEADEARLTALTSYLKIEAPFDGTVSVRNADIGDFAQAGGGGNMVQPLFVVVRTDVVRVFADLPETEVSLVNPGDPAVVRVPSLAGREFTGSVTRTSWSLDPTTRTLHTEIDVPNPKGELRPGMYAEVSIHLAETPDALVVPASAVVTQDNQTVCFVVADGKAIRKPVTVGLKSGSEVAIAAGLTGDELVVQAKGASLTDGQPVLLIAPMPAK